MNFFYKSQLLTHARELAQKILKSAPLSIAAIKEVVRETDMLPIAQCYQILRTGEWPAFQKMLDSGDAIEGATAHQERRDPVWKGR